MTRTTTIRSALFASLTTLLLAAGCSSPQRGEADFLLSDEKLKDPISGTLEAPPLGAPRAKLPPDEVLMKKKEAEKDGDTKPDERDEAKKK